MYASDFIELLNSKKVFDITMISVNNNDIDGIEYGNGDSIIIRSRSDKDTEDRIDELEEETYYLKSSLNDASVSLNKLIDRVADPMFEDYALMHPDLWEKLKEIPTEDLEEFIKISIDWYNIKEEIQDIADNF